MLMPNKKAILWVLPKWPLPACDGSRQATVSLIRTLSEQGEIIDLLVLADAHECIDSTEARRELGIRNVHVVPRRKRLQRSSELLAMLFAATVEPWNPATMHRFSSRTIRRSIAALLENSPAWDIVVYEGLHAAGHRLRHGSYERPAGDVAFIYRAQNREARLWEGKRRQAKRGYEKLFLSHQARCVNKFEKSVVSGVDGLAPLSSIDLESFRGAMNGSGVPPTRLVPVGLEFNRPAPFPDEGGLPLLFIGRLDWEPNVDGLRWFMREVWPKLVVARPEICLTVAGSGDGRAAQKLLSGIARVEFIGQVGEVESLYRKTALSIVPVFYGSGTRVKVLEAARYGRAVLSTTAGVEGIPLVSGQSFLEGNSAAEWLAILSGVPLSELRRLGHRAFDDIREHFDATRAANEFCTLLAEVRERRVCHTP